MASVSKMSQADKDATWALRSAGVSQRDIAGLLGRHSSTIDALVRRHGGVAPEPAKRSGRVLGLEEREEISRGLVVGKTLTAIAIEIGRHKSTVSREVKRHGGSESYRAALADEQAWLNAKRPKACRLELLPDLALLVAEGLRKRWSPKQISSTLKRDYPADVDKHVSHEAIYQSLFVQSRGVFKKELSAYLRSRRTARRSQNAPAVPPGRGQIKNAVSIRERPAEVEDRAVPGHWEGDLLCGANSSQVATLVERHSRFVMLVKIPSKETETVVDALIEKIQLLPAVLKKTLTWDRGSEMAEHLRFTVATNVSVYFCDPRSPWQRGSNESTNRLLREYLPRYSNLCMLRQDELDKIAEQLNTRPRETLGWDTPAMALARCVASTG